jgi:hypothetical protein
LRLCQYDQGADQASFSFYDRYCRGTHVKIRGTIGQWPVDLTIELDDHELSRLKGMGVAEEEEHERPEPTRAVPAARLHDPHWDAAQDVLRQAGQLDGPRLSQAIEAVTGNPAATKRLLVRLRHSPNVRLESSADVHIYHWLE